jgi:hypothetical protein
MHASELVHIQLNEADGKVQVINNRPDPLTDATAHIGVYNLDGELLYDHETKLTAAPDAATDLGPIEIPPTISTAPPASSPTAGAAPPAPSPIRFIKLELRSNAGLLLSTNFYWQSQTGNPDDLTALNQLPMVTLTATAQRVGGRVTVTLKNPTTQIALMAHLQLRRKSGERILPAFYSDNYVSLVPGESKTITIDAAPGDFHGQDALIVVDGWNVTVATAFLPGIIIAPNLEAQPELSPATGLPLATTGLRP